jgi:hypothetical protein
MMLRRAQTFCAFAATKNEMCKSKEPPSSILPHLSLEHIFLQPLLKHNFHSIIVQDTIFETTMTNIPKRSLIFHNRRELQQL